MYSFNQDTITAVLFDIDETLTHSIADNGSNAKRCDSSGGDISGCDGKGPDFARIFAAIRRQARLYPDAEPTIRILHEAGFDLYTATTNASTVACAKLALGGLADANGSPFFKGILGGSQISPGGKTSPQFFIDLLAHYNLAADSVVHVGDDPERDIAYARAAGIRNLVQIDRSLSEAVRPLPHSGFVINRLDLLPQLLGIETMAASRGG